MKLMYIIVRQDNENDVMNTLIKNNYRITKLATSGGFLKRGNTTFISCCQDNEVQNAIDLIKNECGKRKRIQIDMPINVSSSAINYSAVPTQIEIGGATIIVTDVFKYEKF